MHNFHNILLPDFISIHLKGGPAFATSVANSISGREVRVSERRHAIQKYRLSGCRLSHEQFQEFNCFFRARMGVGYGFRIRDHADFKLDASIIGDGAKKEFELFKTYHDDISSYRRRITAVREEGFLCNSLPSSVDYIRGIIHMEIPPPEGFNIGVSAEFDVIVRFCSDEFKYSFCQDGSIQVEEIDLVEVLP